MSEAPERIYAAPSFEEGWSRIGHWNVEFGWDLDDVEYVRWDVVKSLEAKLAKAVEIITVCRDMIDEVAHPSDPFSAMLNAYLAELEEDRYECSRKA